VFTGSREKVMLDEILLPGKIWNLDKGSFFKI